MHSMSSVIEGNRSIITHREDIISGTLSDTVKVVPLRQGKRGISRATGFLLHPTMGLAFSAKGGELPTDKKCPSGAGHAHLEVDFHKITSWVEVK